MVLSSFYEESSAGLAVSPLQASRFAKEIADDFNPIHDPGGKRFCVPGDLLFSLVLERYGLSEQMSLRFSGMVGEGVVLQFPQTLEPAFSICDAAGKSYLEVERSGAILYDQQILWDFAQAYVAFSGQNFPHVLVPLLREHGVMINSERPLVIYEQMSINVSRLNLAGPWLEPARHEVRIEGKRAEVSLGFRIFDTAGELGKGAKKLVVGGLKPYDEAVSEQLIREYLSRKAEYRSAAA